MKWLLKLSLLSLCLVAFGCSSSEAVTPENPDPPPGDTESLQVDAPEPG